MANPLIVQTEDCGLVVSVSYQVRHHTVSDVAIVMYDKYPCDKDLASGIEYYRLVTIGFAVNTDNSCFEFVIHGMSLVLYLPVNCQCKFVRVRECQLSNTGQLRYKMYIICLQPL